MPEVPICAYATTCKAIKKTMEIAERQRLMHFLMHVNENYEAIRGQILLLDPLPNVNRAYSMIQRVETQRNVTRNMTANREVAANVMRTIINSFEEADSMTNALAAKGGVRGKKDFKKTKGNRFCDHCQRTGHTSDQCFKIIGYPDWYQGPKDNSTRPRRIGRVTTHLANSEVAHDSPLDHAHDSQELPAVGHGKVDSNLVQALAQEMMRLVKGQQGSA